MPGKLDGIYAASPLWLQQMAITSYGIVWKRRRFGGCFPRAVQEFTEREMFSPDHWVEHQTTELRRLVIHAQRSVPHYNQTLLRSGIAAPAMGLLTLADLPLLPLLTKEMIRDNPNAFVSQNSPRLHDYATSGTTGTPLTVKFSTAMQQRWAGRL